MRKLVSLILAAAFAAASVTAMAQKPTAEECKKDPKMKGCEQMKK